MKKTGYIVMKNDFNGESKIAKSQVFEKKETAEFLCQGLKMFQPKDSIETFYILQIELVPDDVFEYTTRIA